MKINITRESTYADSLRKYKVELDKVIIGEIADGESKDFQVEPGEHTLRLKIDVARSNELTFDATSDKAINFRCVSSLKGRKAWLAALYLFLPHKYIKLERID